MTPERKSLIDDRKWLQERNREYREQILANRNKIISINKECAKLRQREFARRKSVDWSPLMSPSERSQRLSDLGF